MSEEVVRLINNSDVTQQIYSPDGRLIKFGARAVESFPAPIAREFLAQCRRYVQVYTDTIIPVMAGQKTTWVANMTGNAKLRGTVSITRFDPSQKRYTTSEIAHPNAEPRLIQYELKGGQVDTGPDDNVNMPPIQVRIPAFARLPVPSSVADWLENKDNLQDEEYRGAVKKCRAPSAFEPNETWPLYEVMFYAHMVDQNLGKFEDGKFMKAYKGQLPNDQVDEMKKSLLRDLFFVLVDDRYNLPSHDAYRAALNRKLDTLENRTKPGEKPSQAAAAT